jgi:hypothetical protein
MLSSGNSRHSRFCWPPTIFLKLFYFLHPFLEEAGELPQQVDNDVVKEPPHVLDRVRLNYPRPCASGVSSESRSTRKSFAPLCSTVAGPFLLSGTPVDSKDFRTCRSEYQPSPGCVSTPCEKLEPLLVCPLPQILNDGFDFLGGFVFQLVAPQNRHYYSLAGQVEVLLGEDLLQYYVIQ